MLHTCSYIWMEVLTSHGTSIQPARSTLRPRNRPDFRFRSRKVAKSGEASQQRKLHDLLTMHLKYSSRNAEVSTTQNWKNICKTILSGWNFHTVQLESFLKCSWIQFNPVICAFQSPFQVSSCFRLGFFIDLHKGSWTIHQILVLHRLCLYRPIPLFPFTF